MRLTALRVVRSHFSGFGARFQRSTRTLDREWRKALQCGHREPRRAANRQELPVSDLLVAVRLRMENRQRFGGREAFVRLTRPGQNG